MEKISPWTWEKWPWEKEGEYYDALEKVKGLAPFTEHFTKVGIKPHYLMERGIVFSQSEYKHIEEAIEHKKRFAVVTGLKVRKKIHFGHKCIIDQMVWYQKMGGDVFIVLSDLESWFWDRTSIKDSVKNATEYILNYLALGIQIGRCQIYSQWARKEVICLGLSFSEGVDCAEVKNYFNDFKNLNTIGKTLFPLIVASDIAHTQLKKYGGKRPVIVPVGADQFEYISFATNIIKKYNMLHIPSVTYNRLLPGRNGDVMTEKNAIFLTDEPEVVYERLMKATTSEGKPFQCVLYEMLRFHHENNEYVMKVFDDCSKNNCNKCKKEIADYFSDWVRKFRERKKKLEDEKDVLRFMLDQEIPRETESIIDVTEIIR